MSKKPNYFKLGLFVILALLLLAGFLLAFGAVGFFKKELLMETCFNESVQGLDIGSEVKYKGVNIGRVKEITTPTHKYGVPSDYVLVIFTVGENAYAGQTGHTIRDRMEQAISKNLQVRLAFKGITGVAFLEMDYTVNGKNDIDVHWQPKHLYIPSQKSKMANMGDALTKIMDSLAKMEIGQMSQSLDKLFNTLNQKAQDLDTNAISTQISSFLEEIRTTNSRILKALDSKEVQEIVGDAHDSFVSMKQILKTIETSLSDTLEDLSDAAGNASQITKNLNQGILAESGEVSAHVKEFMHSLHRTANMLETIVWRNSDTFGKVVDDFSKSAENLNQLINELRYYPGRVLLEKPPKSYVKKKNTEQNE